MERNEAERFRPGTRIGLLGGSFDPPHGGHLHLSRAALTRFGLDSVVWLVSPGNPLKRRSPAPLTDRVKAARGLVDHPRISVSDVEARLGTHVTAHTLARLTQRHPAVRFTWLMGADNLAQLHQWEDWHAIMRRVPVGVVARPGTRIAARASVASKVYRSARIAGRASHLLGQSVAPAWCFVNVPLMNVSSTDLRASGVWQGAEET